ncbi:MAG: type II toxin-antitoxin system prevent-host-death family antitoxin [Terrimicrobiaceae bacterium]
MISVNISEAKANLSKYVDQARKGVVVQICERNRPVARLCPLNEETRPKRAFGQYRGQVKMAADFEEWTPDLDEMFFGRSKAFEKPRTC